MTKDTYYVALPFLTGEDGSPVAGEEGQCNVIGDIGHDRLRVLTV